MGIFKRAIRDKLRFPSYLLKAHFFSVLKVFHIFNILGPTSQACQGVNNLHFTASSSNAVADERSAMLSLFDTLCTMLAHHNIGNMANDVCTVLVPL